jgi:hypothetical protein
MDNGLSLIPIIRLLWDMELQKFSMGLLDFNKQLEILVPKPGKGAIQIHKPLIKQMFFP